MLHEEEGQSIDDLKYDLVPGFKDKAYRLFKESHRKITLSPFIPLFSEKASEIYPHISELLIKEHGFKGIAIIWDQFDEHLEYFPPAFPSREVSFLRDFAEKVETSGDNQLHLILISHNLPYTYIRGKIAKEGLDNWMTLEGRFSPHRLTAIEEAEQLIDYAIVQVKEEEEWNKVSEQIAKGPTGMVEDGNLNLYTADKLFDFFKEAAENTPETKDVIMNYNEAMGKVSERREILTQRVMKTVGTVGIIKAKFPLIPLSSTLSNLALLLDLEEGKF